MILKINFFDFEHIPVLSSYNNNYYKHKTLYFYMREECDEFSNTYTFTGIDIYGKPFYIGCSNQPIEENPEIDFQVQYT